jgi:hypothetical protein
MSNNEYQKGLLSSALAGALSPKRIQGLWYEDKSIALDGYTFEECRFDKCELHINNAETVSFLNCYISNDTHFVYGRSALSAIKLFNSKTDWYYANHPYWVPQKDSKGRITLNNDYLSGLAGLLSTNE